MTIYRIHNISLYDMYIYIIYTGHCLLVYLLISLSFYLSISYMFIYLSVCLSVCLSYLILSYLISSHLIWSYPIYLSICLSVCLSIYLSLSLSLSFFHLSICLAVCMSIYLYQIQCPWHKFLYKFFTRGFLCNSLVEQLCTRFGGKVFPWTAELVGPWVSGPVGPWNTSGHFSTYMIFDIHIYIILYINYINIHHIFKQIYMWMQTSLTSKASCLASLASWVLHQVSSHSGCWIGFSPNLLRSSCGKPDDKPTI